MSDIENIDTDPTSEDENVETIRHLFVDHVQYRHFVDGQKPARRAAFITMHGGAYGTLKINDHIDPKLAKGIFVPGKEYKVWVRFSSDTPKSTNNGAIKGATAGIGIKLFNVPGVNILDNETWPGVDPDTGETTNSPATNVDFVLQNSVVFFAKDAAQMAKFKQAAVDGNFDTVFAKAPENENLVKILDYMGDQKPESLLTSTYWSCIPFELGSQEQWCKYLLVPKQSASSGTSDPTAKNYLKEDLQQSLKLAPAEFKLKIHYWTDASQSIYNANDPWAMTDGTPEAQDPNIFEVATLTLPKQDITLRGVEDYSESLSYNPWRTIEAHTPVGSIADARRVVYISSSHKRRDLNGQVLGEPRTPRPDKLYPNGNPEYLDADGNPYPNSERPWPLEPDGPTESDPNKIVRIAIHPGIGVARVGNSMEFGNGDMFIGPEIDTPAPMSVDGTRDSTGAIKRQAARFRLYGYNEADEVVREITASDAVTTIEWSVHLANKKAQWFQFDRSFDIANAEETMVPLRNPRTIDRNLLAIDGGVRKISGANVNGMNSVKFDQGQFYGKNIYLGELRTDEKGRLLVLGGRGKSAPVTDESLLGDCINDNNFNNSNKWYDDTSDGPVHATVTIDGFTIEADSSWVIVAPPNYAPDIIGFRTLYDLLVETHISAGILPMPDKISFTDHILPSLQRLDNLKWVNKGFETEFGIDGRFNFTDPVLIAKLATPTPEGDADTTKEQIFNSFHSPYAKSSLHTAWPFIYGDAFAIENFSDDQAYDPRDPLSTLPLSPLRYHYFSEWVKGNFVNDWNPTAIPVHELDSLPLQKQPAMLDKAALHYCLADAFHPGCEVTWPVRHSTMYRAPFRINEAAIEVQAPPQNSYLGKIGALEPGGPLYGQSAGGITRWMALPWQGDTSRCRAGYDENLLMDVPAFWPARVPNHVLTEANYNIFMNANNSPDTRTNAYRTRAKWWGLLPNSEGPDKEDKEKYMQAMVDDFSKMYIVEARPGDPNLPNFPQKIYVGKNIV